MAHFTTLGVLQTALLLAAVWIVRVYTSWATNRLDRERIPVRLLLFAIMLADVITARAEDAGVPAQSEEREAAE